MITPVVRLSYANVWEPKPDPSGNLKYSACLLIPKSDAKAVEWFKSQVEAATSAGVAKGTFNVAASKSRAFKNPLRDGDDKYAEATDEQKAKCASYRGHYFINVSSVNPIGIVDQRAQPIMDQSLVYSGCWARLDINMKAYNRNGGLGVGAYVNNLMKVRDDDRFDGRQDAASAFAGYAEESDLQ